MRMGWFIVTINKSSKWAVSLLFFIFLWTDSLFGGFVVE